MLSDGNSMRQSTRTTFALLAAAIALCGRPNLSRADDFTFEDLVSDAKNYVTAPIHWDESDWLFFGGSIAAIAVAHNFDSRVRDHFAPSGAAGLTGADTDEVRDILPAASLLAGTWLISEITDDSFANTEAYTMAEAAGFSTLTAEALKYAAGRERPDQTTDPNDWRDAGSSFPSLHATAAFAIGAVFAESGSDEYRWWRRVLGYGMAGATAYLRLHENQHWLSDTVAGAALGIATARFSTHRRLERAHDWNLSVTPSRSGGLMLTLNLIVD
jgi:membrane-associated phospholipid phosphatase